MAIDNINPDVVQLWFHYEEIAMHFNEMLMQYRLQLMGGAGVISVIAGYLVGEKVTDPIVKDQLKALISTGILILVTAAAYLDLYYYNELLRGAVAAILELEEQYPYLNMSTAIKSQFCAPGANCELSGASFKIKATYTFIILPILIFTVWSWITLYRSMTRK